MTAIESTPFERAICKWVLELPQTWTPLDFDQLAEVEEKALHRLVIGGFVQARLTVVLTVGGLAFGKLRVRVCGDYPDVLRQDVLRHLAAHGAIDKNGRVTKAISMAVGRYEETRLTSEGALARQTFTGTVITETAYCHDGTVREKREAGTDYELFSRVSGGLDGSGGVRPPGSVERESAPVEVPQATHMVNDADSNALVDACTQAITALASVDENWKRSNNSGSPARPSSEALANAEILLYERLQRLSRLARQFGANASHVEVIDRFLRWGESGSPHPARSNSGYVTELQKVLGSIISDAQREIGSHHIYAPHSQFTIQAGAAPVSIDNSIKVGGDVINSQVGQTLINCTNMIQQQSSGARKELLEELQRGVEQLLKKLPADKNDEATQIAENFSVVVKQATSGRPNRAWYSVSAEGLLEASKWVKDFTGNIIGTLGQLGRLLWPDFKLRDAD